MSETTKPYELQGLCIQLDSLKGMLERTHWRLFWANGSHGGNQVFATKDRHAFTSKPQPTNLTGNDK